MAMIKRSEVPSWLTVFEWSMSSVVCYVTPQSDGSPLIFAMA